MNRAYALLNVKELAEADDFVTVRGMASTPTTDRMGDIVEPLGAKFKLPMPLLWQHDAKKPIGHVTFAKATKTGIPFEATIPRVKEAGVLKDRIDEAIQSLKHRLVAATSIGFQAIEGAVERLESGGLRFKEWEWLELSLVTIPANAEATITSIKSLDEAQMRAASGTARQVDVGSTPGATGTKTKPLTGLFSDPAKGHKVKTIKEQIEGFEAKRQASDARMTAIMDEAAEAGSTLDAAQKQEYDALAAEVKEVDEHLVRLRQREAANATTAKAVAGDNPEDASATRQGLPRISMGKSMLPKGVPFTRFALVQAKAKGNLMQAEVLSRQFKDTPEVNLACKAAVAAGTTTDSTWASPLVELQEMQSEFVDFLRPQTFLGRIPGIRRVPFNIKFSRQTAGTTGTFVGEGLPKPLGAMAFETLELLWAKAATIIVMTDELLRFSNPQAEILARDDLAAGIARYLDLRFIDPAYAGVSNVSPASITNGVTPIASLGTTVALISDTVELAMNEFITANMPLSSLVWIMNPSTALSLSLKRTSQDVYAFPQIGPNGGTFFGYPVITSNNVALSASPTESFVVLMDPTNVMVADDGGVSIDMSNEASLQMDGAPSAGAQSLVSLWQNNMVALRAERYINWRKRRDDAVSVITMNASW